MRYTGINFENVKFNNRSAILHLLYSEGAMSRKDIAGRTGLTAASVTQLCGKLLEEGVIVELGEAVEEKRAGRRKIPVDINPGYRYIPCIAIEAQETHVSVADCRGNLIGQTVLTTDSTIPAKEFLWNAAEEIRKILWDKGISRYDLLGAAVSVPGQVDREKGISVNSYSIWNYPVPVADILKEQLGVAVVVENNLKSAAECEILFGSGRKASDFLVVKWGPGVGSAIIIDHRIYKGAEGISGELGHTTLGKNGRLCNCGRRGCLETEISTHAIMRDIQTAYAEEPEEVPAFAAWIQAGNAMSYRNVSQWAALDDGGMQRILAEKIDKLAFSVRNYCALINPERIVLTGYMFDVEGMYERFVDSYREYDETIREDFLVRSNIREQKEHMACLATALNAFFFSMNHIEAKNE